MSEDKNQNNPFAENEEIKEEIKEEPKEDIKEEDDI